MAAALFAAPASASDDPCAVPRPPGATRSFSAAAARTAPAVVSVLVIRPRRVDSVFGGPDRTPPFPDAPLERSFASGFILSPDGFVATSAHVVFDARETWIAMADGRRLQARVAGFDRDADVALLKVEASGLPAAPLEPQRRVCPGEWVAAMGAPFGFEHTVTAGVVSAYPRFLPGGSVLPLIQTDVAINPGSSGGPLFTSDGAVVGMNSLIYSDNGIFAGVSFALPADQVLRIVSRIRAGRSRRAELGVVTQPVTADLARAFGLGETGGALVVKVAPGSAAEAAGLRSGDVLVATGSRRTASHAQIEEEFSALKPGESLALRLWRGEAMSTVRVHAQAARTQADASPTARTAPEIRLGLGLAPAGATAGLPAGVYVDDVVGSSLLAGIEPGDRITAVNGIPVATASEFDAALRAAADKPTVALLVERGGVASYVPVDRLGR
ncbi:trypsin-like peptidase domain-containing protein [Caenimonas aquaedulcis]|uniref:Probable periplasmic serine endoprotease DegP-like n=1 Tax=Caenimonas aquaedulcis TaxID=2793270 RepID=A0A931H893_9BURK|nr:trypsin-like peptidase domain-containing protein [Caenimonas aquaedulcis]MBG9390217.1 trypsin-like peptidase domain-containing protein [Caenimonas aquaedulcis]